MTEFEKSISSHVNASNSLCLNPDPKAVITKHSIGVPAIAFLNVFSSCGVKDLDALLAFLDFGFPCLVEKKQKRGRQWEIPV